MDQDDFFLKWEKDEKSKLAEEVASNYVEATWLKVVNMYSEALTEQPNNPEYLFNYGYLMQLKAKRLMHEAAEYYQKGLESNLLNNNYSWISGKLHAQLIQARAQLLENHKSVEYYKNKLREFPDEPQMYYYLVQCYLNVDQIHEAKKVVETGMKLFPNHAMLNYYQGEIHSRHGNVEEALKAWEKSAILDAQLIDGRFSRAFLLEREQRFKECAQEWRLIVEFMDKYNFNKEFPINELKRIEKLLGNS
ncbi:tetratricopeptide repeat protein [Paenibacillus marinisediminis]